MNYGYTVAASGALTAMHRQDVAANNLANIETIGFKEDLAATMARPAARVEDGLWDMPSNALLERLGAGTLLAPSRTTFSQGTITPTGNELDLAIKGDGFFMVRPGGSAGADDIRLTRDGRFTLTAAGELVTAADGSAVLGDSGSAIRLLPGLHVTVNSDGTVMQRGREVARLGLVDFDDRSGLHKQGANLFAADPQTMGSRREARGEVVQKAIERSSVDPIMAMMKVQDAANAVMLNLRVMQMHDEMTGRAIASLGRVA